MGTLEYNRRDFLRAMGLGAASLVVLKRLFADDTSSAKKLNFTFIFADDLGWTGLGCCGSDLYETPNIDRLARQDVRFTDVYAASPVYTPTRASIMTGKYSAWLYMTIWYESSVNPPRGRRLIPPITEGNLPHEQMTIAEVLKEAGYYTAHVGK